jgi:asparagine synthase (glutamine-hydrolysing)
MCGIAGLFGHFSASQLRDGVEDLQHRLAHRGPDGVGTWIHPESGIGLAHRRLSIIDLSSAASQPMSAVGGRYTVVFNGEITNFKALVPGLKTAGYSLNEHSDTAVLAPLYHQYGPAMLNKLEGMFAFAIWDAETRSLFVARDALGIKPLYIATTPHGIAFASELKALVGIPGLNTQPDPAALAEYITYLYTPSERTMVQGVKKLRPGHYMLLKRNTEGQGNGQGGLMGATPVRWYQPPLPEIVHGKPVYNFSKTPENLRDVLDTVIAEQCTSDVPIGAFLSGGVDSAAIVASMCSTGNMPAAAYCISFGNAPGMAAEGFSEDIGYARMVANRYGVKLTEVQADSTAILGRLPTLAAMLDEPEADPAPLFVQDICGLARADGIKVLLSGTGGDDVMSGYRRHQTARLREWLGPFSGVAGAALGVGALALTGPLRRKMRHLAPLLQADEDDFITLAFTTNSRPDAWKLLQPAWREDIRSRWPASFRSDLTRVVEETRGQNILNRLLYAELFGFLPDHNLNYGDKASMASGVEVRVPLIDRRVLSFMADVPPEKKLHRMRLKSFFKDSQSGRLPEEVLNRSKTGFGAPIRLWLTGEGRSMVEETLFAPNSPAREWFDFSAMRSLWESTCKGHADGAYTILALCMAVWWRQAFKA